MVSKYLMKIKNETHFNRWFRINKPGSCLMSEWRDHLFPDLVGVNENYLFPDLVGVNENYLFPNVVGATKNFLFPDLVEVSKKL